VKILVDENIPAMTVSELRRRGHDVLDFRGTQEEGSADSEVWNLAQKESRLLITTDKGFAQLRQSEHAGVLILQLGRTSQTPRLLCEIAI
jgi:predicted nuclease of predicted toxin-antitoxin system